MRVDVLTLFPDMFATLHQSLLGKALEKELWQLNVVNFRDYTHDKHQHVDDTPYGGGAGMLLKPEPIYEAMDALPKLPKRRVILLDPAGRQFNQTVADEWSQSEQLVFICGHYEGYDERIRGLVTEEASLGDFVITGGELAAMTMIDATVRLLPGVLGNEDSPITDSFATGLLEYPQYTRPPEYRGMKVPEVLMNGDHGKIGRWRYKEALRRTLERRPDLLRDYPLDKMGRELLREVKEEENTHEIDDQ
ncbi:tRNA (guanosine(37)-N1)-methyltransferase TrmD [Schleiferilactobacillus harbinensis]|jgi:tRNA (guanine37-N1)-methyltransferase|uniref:tRNA (guanine-N(1)-)-methyltransferase n=1 Tax=Schleiferilactobacillus harbinensis DSM 16991 TaxID=1122147 RepID=A0A0R1X4Q0_9LACO|nr:tRNA (guanosine(37)-N1)-methyltransferase TrmD [Schleiferilactobacillus harbinensis]KRM24929.1 tRNA (guanine-N(1)-)-methyltransferase [Schleiferilactobacillus harbinensis DSM 16991]QFR65131.1 tRNA (guanosine(37)-N1)-methyltransferase TrmD [Schleiferilactobacillus harbinensis]